MAHTVDTSNKSFRIALWVILLYHMAILTRLIILKKPLGFVKKHFIDLSHHYNWRAFKTNINNGHLNLQPFHTIKMYLADNMPLKLAIMNLVGNVAGFIPLGILLPFLFVRLRSAMATILSVFFISLCFEIFQLFGMLGVCDVDDLILNTLGGIIGYLIYKIIARMVIVQ